MRVVILFYHPKDPKNVEDIARVASRLGVELLVVPRPGGPSLGGVEPRPRIVSLGEAAELLRGCFKVLLETYGFRYLDEVGLDCEAGCVALLLGAEDYGMPRHVAEALGVDEVARIPMAVEGMSYNVASSAVMGLYEVFARCGAR